MELILQQDIRGKTVIDIADFSKPFSKICPISVERHPGKTFKEVLVDDLKSGADKMGYAKYKDKLISAGVVTESELSTGG